MKISKNTFIITNQLGKDDVQKEVAKICVSLAQQSFHDQSDYLCKTSCFYMRWKLFVESCFIIFRLTLFACQILST